MDDDGSNTLSFPEFKKAMREVGMTSLSDTEIVMLFKRFGEDSGLFCDHLGFIYFAFIQIAQVLVLCNTMIFSTQSR
jgi:hypothetical protein